MNGANDPLAKERSKNTGKNAVWSILNGERGTVGAWNPKENLRSRKCWSLSELVSILVIVEIEKNQERKIINSWKC